MQRFSRRWGGGRSACAREWRGGRAAARPGRERNAPHTRISEINLTEIIIMAQRMRSKSHGRLCGTWKNFSRSTTTMAPHHRVWPGGPTWLLSPSRNGTEIHAGEAAGFAALCQGEKILDSSLKAITQFASLFLPSTDRLLCPHAGILSLPDADDAAVVITRGFFSGG